MDRAGSGAPADESLNRNAPFGGPDGQGPVLVALLIKTLIEMPSNGSPHGQGPVLVPVLYES